MFRRLATISLASAAVMVAGYGAPAFAGSNGQQRSIIIVSGSNAKQGGFSQSRIISRRGSDVMLNPQPLPPRQK